VAPTETDTSIDIATNPSKVALIQHTDTFVRQTFNESLQLELSVLSEYARSKAIDDPKAWPKVHDAWSDHC
jgi:hypothetical protein